MVKNTTKICRHINMSVFFVLEPLDISQHGCKLFLQFHLRGKLVLLSAKTIRWRWDLSWTSSNAAQRRRSSIPGSTFFPSSALSRDWNQKVLIWKETSQIPEWWEWSVGPTLHTRQVVEDETNFGRTFLSHQERKKKNRNWCKCGKLL